MASKTVTVWLFVVARQKNRGGPVVVSYVDRYSANRAWDDWYKTGYSCGLVVTVTIPAAPRRGE